MVNAKRQSGRQDQASSSKRSSEPAGDENGDANGEHPVKRSRVSRACDQCRQSRERCDGAQPNCQTCTAQSRTCSYNEQPKKRGIQPNYIRTLELALAWIFQTFPEVEARLTSALPVDGDDARRLIGGKDAATTESLHTAWRDSLANKQIEQLLSGVAIDHVGRSINGNGHLPYDSPPLSAPSDASGRRQDNITASEVFYPAENGLTGQAVFYQLPENSWALLEYYFAFTHSWLPMADKSSILKTMYAYPATGLPRISVNKAEHAELWAIMALVTTQRIQETSRRSDVRWMSDLAESLLPTGNVSWELPHIRALIILAMIDMHNGHMLGAWLRIGTVARLLYLFQLLRRLGQFTKWCRHIHLVAYVLESALALHMESPGHLTPEYMTSIGFIEEDGMEEWMPWQDPLDTSSQSNKAPTRSFSTLNELVRIYMRLGTGSSAQRQFGVPHQSSGDSAVFSLIKNAALPKDRVQPSLLLSAHFTPIPNWSSNAFVTGDPSVGQSGANDPQLARAIDTPDLQRDHPFMSIPSETAASGLDATPTVVPFSSAQWSGTAMSAAAQPVSPEARYDGTSADIFEELANLERQDSIQQPEFLRNLGFAPDFDLAEFFGEDYQPSDPLLAYLQPSSYGATQNSVETGGYI